jgi:hypothetical protein
VNADGSYVFNPADGSKLNIGGGPVTKFTYTVSDGKGGVDTSTGSIRQGLPAPPPPVGTPPPPPTVTPPAAPARHPTSLDDFITQWVEVAGYPGNITRAQADQARAQFGLPALTDERWNAVTAETKKQDAFGIAPSAAPEGQVDSSLVEGITGYDLGIEPLPSWWPPAQ